MEHSINLSDIQNGLRRGRALRSDAAHQGLARLGTGLRHLWTRPTALNHQAR